MLHINAGAIQSARCRDGPLAAAPPPPLAATLPLAAAACRWHALARRHGGQNHHSRCRVPRLHRLPHRPANADPGCAVSGKSGAGAGCGWSPTALADGGANRGLLRSTAFDCDCFYSPMPPHPPSPAAGTASTLSGRLATSQAPTASASAATALCCWVRCRGAAVLRPAIAVGFGQAVHPPLLMASAEPATRTPAPLPNPHCRLLKARGSEVGSRLLVGPRRHCVRRCRCRWLPFWWLAGAVLLPVHACAGGAAVSRRGAGMLLLPAALPYATAVP